MPLDFSGKNLQGRSFKNQNLTGANFTGANLTGADFTGANLTGADFSNIKAGLNNHRVVVSFLLSLATGFFAGAIAVLMSSLLCGSNSNNLIAGAIALTGCITFLIISIREGFTNTFITVIGTIAILGILLGFISVVFNQIEIGYVTLDAATNLAISIFSVFFITIFLSFITAVISIKKVETISLISAVISAIFISLFATGRISRNISIEQKGWLGISIASGIAVLIIILCANISRRILAGDENHIFIRIIAIRIAAIGGTSFRGANLTGANFTEATLKNTDFTKANLTHTIWYRAKQLEFARLENTILDNPAVRDLLVNRNPSHISYENVCLEGACLVGLDLREVNYKNANLSKANLTGANLSKADLTGAYLTQANLQRANLEESILTKTQAIGTDFTQAYLTGVCGLDTWNIDSTTKLDGVNCRFVYLLNNQRERRPSSGEFAPGEFTNLFQVALNTVDLIFRNGLNLSALSAALNNLQTENPGTNIQVKGIENIGDGIVVVKVEVATDIDKGKIHSEINQGYQLALQAIEARYQAELQSKDEQITLYRQHQADLKALMQIFPPKVNQSEDKLVVIKLGDGDLSRGFSVTLQIGKEGERPRFESSGRLPRAIELSESCNQWQTAYRHSLRTSLRLDIPDTQITNISSREFFDECYTSAKILKEHLNCWLNSETFRPIKEQLLEQLNTSDSIRIILQTEDNQIRKLPFQVWNFFERYSRAEMALGIQAYERVEKSLSPVGKVQILAILGNSRGIDIQKDRVILEQLPNVEITFLVEPQRQQLNDELWSQPCDILFFAGHSASTADGEAGHIYINQNDILTISQLRNALKKAIFQGLQLAIFNSCDGLGLAVDLADLQLPQIIVMREPVPDKIAQEFLKNFLTEFSGGKSLSQSVREAREKLQGLEDEFPCATWLPVICQNPAHTPPTWFELVGE